MGAKTITVCMMLLLFGTAQTIAIPNNSSVNSIEINPLFVAEEYIISSERLSPDGNYLLVSSYSPISMSQSLNHIYLMDIKNKNLWKNRL